MKTIVKIWKWLASLIGNIVLLAMTCFLGSIITMLFLERFDKTK